MFQVYSQIKVSMYYYSELSFVYHHILLWKLFLDHFKSENDPEYITILPETSYKIKADIKMAC